MLSSFVQDRRQRVVSRLDLHETIVLFSAGAPIHKPGGLDQTYPFFPYPEYYWLTGLNRAHGVLAYDPKEGWTHFVEPITPAERLWEGAEHEVDGEDIAGFSQWLADRRHRPKVVVGAPIAGVESDPEYVQCVHNHVDAARRPKDAFELDLMRRAAAATAAGHARARELARPGVSERQIGIELETAMFLNGADQTGYGTIVASGPRSAILHGVPTSRVLGKDEFLLVDAGGAIDGYTADVTRTWFTGALAGRHKAIYDIVLAAELAGIDKARAGVEWHAVHREAASVIAQGLLDLGLLRGSMDGVLESGAISVFFPHGVGHLVGLGVRDVGGRAAGREPDRRVCGVRVRVDLPLEPGFVMTVEPGLYFVDAILDLPEFREKFHDQVVWEAVEAWRGIGGVRIEDDVLITADGPPEILTAAIPK